MTTNKSKCCPECGEDISAHGMDFSLILPAYAKMADIKEQGSCYDPLDYSEFYSASNEQDSPKPNIQSECQCGHSENRAFYEAEIAKLQAENNRLLNGVCSVISDGIKLKEEHRKEIEELDLSLENTKMCPDDREAVRVVMRFHKAKHLEVKR